MCDNEISIFWFRRDLRLDDNVGLYNALKGRERVLPIFIFDTGILDKLPLEDARVTFIHQNLQKMRKALEMEHDSSLALYYGKPEDVFRSLLSTYEVRSVYTNHDYEPYAKDRDERIEKLMATNNVEFKTFKDQVIFEKEEIVKADGTPYVVFTPYKNRWKERFEPKMDTVSYDPSTLSGNFLKCTDLPDVSLADLGFTPSTIQVPDFNVHPTLIEQYEATRNFPAIQNGTSRIGPHLRFGTVSIRGVMRKAIVENNEVFWNELIWREFFMQILWYFPHTISQSFKPKYDRIEWRNNEMEFVKWKNGQTGYALVDAGMRELNSTGYMHNRVRMVAASFLCKHLLIDWRWGEAYFAEKLLDYDQSANVGNWQWAAGSGVDAAPYFRIFNPMTQLEKFDKQRAYIDQWIPELQEFSYPQPIVDHKIARVRCLQTYKSALD
tara:strand:- start:195 stop:1508 length:1314 start_codon:yes stop_codon:yes gene_type:complete